MRMPHDAAGPTPADALIAYLQAQGGSDRTACWAADGSPDPLAARALAMSLRTRAGRLLGEAILVEQSGNQVLVRLADAMAVRR
jgi:hypothetical protein